MSRDYISSHRLAKVATHLGSRDIAVLGTLERVRIASAAQLERLHFAGDSARHRRRVLQRLADERLICRLDRTVGGERAGSLGYVFVLDVAGQRLLSQVARRPVRRPTTPGRAFISHQLAITELYVRLVEAARAKRTDLREFQAEPACWRQFIDRSGAVTTLKPDAYLRLVTGEWEDSWFIEVDQGTESASTLDRKLTAYRAHWSSGTEQHHRGVYPRVLWLVPDERRYRQLVDACGRQPEESWKLHQVTLYEDAIGLMTGGPS